MNTPACRTPYWLCGTVGVSLAMTQHPTRIEAHYQLICLRSEDLERLLAKTPEFVLLTLDEGYARDVILIQACSRDKSADRTM